ncbi:MAG: peptide chain release factor N(5)-glutamine methyltransferase [Bacteroidales bacterium]|jgi:release factor glutamine methyltransferase|nr:peptide chain release factor N(5)-glutamine methyltransferase [Bacteroidales bacterium]
MSVNIQTIKEIRFYLTGELARIYPETEINAIANIIIKTLFKTSKLHGLAFHDKRLTHKQAYQVFSICRELKEGKPLQYILGETCFYNCIIKVNNETLIPRPETEEMVDLIIKENKGFRGTILDAGTGSGCIAIALAVNLPGTKITGIDISEGAVKVARENAVINNATVDFLKADIMNFDIKLFKNIDIIVSNPPYVRESEKKQMASNVIDFEPHIALFVPDSEPLKYYLHILKLADEILVTGGRVYFEINEALGGEMNNLLSEYGYYEIMIIRDLNGRERFIKGIRNGGKHNL